MLLETRCVFPLSLRYNGDVEGKLGKSIGEYAVDVGRECYSKRQRLSEQKQQTEGGSDVCVVVQITVQMQEEILGNAYGRSRPEDI